MMDRQRYLRETSEALRKANGDNHGTRRNHSTVPAVGADEPGARALKRLAEALRKEGLAHDGERWQCPSCRSQDRKPDFVLEMRAMGRQLEIRCARRCRPNTIRALLGAPPYFATANPAKGMGRYPYW